MNRMTLTRINPKGMSNRGRVLCFSLIALVILSVLVGCAGQPSGSGGTPALPTAVANTPTGGSLNPPCEQEDTSIEPFVQTKDDQGNAVFVSQTAGITVTVPPQEGHRGEEVIAQMLSPAPGSPGKPNTRILEDLSKELTNSRGDFTATRLVIHFQIVWAADKKCVRAFNPPMKVEITYSKEDVDQAGGDPKKLKFAFADHQDRRWILLSDQKHGFVLQGNEQGGVAIIKEFRNYGDPHIVAGY